MHHQGVKTLGQELQVSATADDGLIEAIETIGDSFCIGVQWHPEVFEMTDPHTRQLFGGFMAAAVEWSTANAAPRAGVGG
jgi:putative glutamine amidotransferase